MKEKLTDICKRIDVNVSPLQEIVDGVIDKYCGALDECMQQIDDALCDASHPITTTMLENYLLNLNSLIYWTGNGLELSTIKESMSKMVKEEKYNQEYSDAEGTIGDKTATAKLNSQDEELIRVCYSQITKLIQHKLDRAGEMSSAIKKIITHRVAELSQVGIQQ